MRDFEFDPAADALTVEITSWLGDEQVGDPLPVVSSSWKITDTAGVTVPGTVEFQVPAAEEWRPLLPDHPLANYGQRYRVRIGFGDQMLTWGWYRADRSQQQGVVIACSGKGLLREVERARFTRPFQTVTGATWQATVTDLLRGILPVTFEGVPNAVMPRTTWEEDRLAAVWEVIESRPARITIDDSATAVVSPAWNDLVPGEAVKELVDGEGGTLVSLQPDGDDNEDPPNAYVVSTVPEGDAEPIVEVWTQPSGPMRWGGPYGYNPAFFASPLNPTDRSQLRAIAQRMTLRAAAQQKRVAFVALPDPRVEVGDVVHVRSELNGVDALARITNLALSRQGMTGDAALL